MPRQRRKLTVEDRVATGHGGRFRSGTGLLVLFGDGRQSCSSPESAPAGRLSGECRSGRLIVGQSCFELGHAMFATTSRVCGWQAENRFLRRSNLYYTRATKFRPVAGHGNLAFPNTGGYQRQVRTFWHWY